MSEEDRQHDEVSDLHPEEGAVGVTARQACDDAVTHDQNELHQLDDCNHRLEEVQIVLDTFVGAQQVIRVHDHMNE